MGKAFLLRYLDDRFAKLADAIGLNGDELNAILRKETTIMGLLEDIKASQEATKVALAGIKADEAAQVAKIQVLMDQLANGAGVTTAQLQELLDGSKAVQAQAETLDASIPAADPAGP